ncbi:hypothetical protein D3P96_03015 [Weissella viridescens]|uniref:BppU N-terminal domain-containing protein n=1 Tax=Weissella viridescens TaxID=1629 RepID=A0A3P2RHP8_WEIVI|nr:BppU family phage baseplate upper protein [Weissella viridescens]RRG18270.1 hypothetical protein D3P96_03015 [Weissella viridescens]
MTTKAEASIPQIKEGKFIIVDTTLRSTDTMWFDEMSGDYGDAGRKVYLAIKDRALSNNPKVPLKPMDLNGMDVRLQGHDANGVFKRVSLATRMIDAEKGRVEITIPREIYINPGAYENAEFEIYEVNGDTVISTVPVGFEVYNNHAHITTNETKQFSDEFNALIKELESATADEIEKLNAKFSELIASVKIANNNVAGLEQSVATWTKNVADKAVALLDGDNQFTGKNDFLVPINGFVTGITNKIYTVNDPKQDVNDINKLRSLPEATTTVDYYSNNGTLNNPMESNYFMVETRKVTRDTAFQTITNMNLVDGEIKQRTVQAMSTQPVFGNWYTTAKWCPWRTLVPYLGDKFVVGLIVPQYRFKGQSVEIKGDISPKETIENTNGGEYTLFDNLPFKFATGQQQVQIGSGNTVFGYFTTGNRIVMQKYMFAGKDAPVIKGGYIGIAGTFALD